MGAEVRSSRLERGMQRVSGAIDALRGLARRWREVGTDAIHDLRGRTTNIEVHSIIPSSAVDEAYLAELHAVSSYDYSPSPVGSGVADRYDAATQLRHMLPRGGYLLVVRSDSDLSAMLGKNRLRGVISLANSQDSERNIRQRASGTG